MSKRVKSHPKKPVVESFEENVTKPVSSLRASTNAVADVWNALLGEQLCFPVTSAQVHLLEAAANLATANLYPRKTEAWDAVALCASRGQECAEDAASAPCHEDADG